MLGGELSVHSELGKGSKFSVRMMLPREVANGEVQQIAPARPRYGYYGDRKTIMVVDDSAEHRTLISDVLVPLGFRVSLAESAESAQAILEVDNPDLMLLDVAMPGMDGWSFAETLRSEMMMFFPIFMVSAHAYDLKYHGVSGTYHDDFIAKPVHLEELLSKMERHLRLRWIDDENEARSVDAITRPPDILLTPLIEAVSIGHVKGAMEELTRLESLDPSHSGFIRRARFLLQRFEFNELNTLISDK